MIGDLHLVWIGGPMPDWAERNAAELRRLNGDRQVRVHGEEVLLPELAARYAEADDLCARSDLLRLSALARYGGWYLDSDFWPLRPLADAERAWFLDGGRMYLSRQQYNRDARLCYSNGVLAASAECPGLRWLIAAAAATPYAGRTTWGPKLVARLVAERPADVRCADAAWWFPGDSGDARAIYAWLLGGQGAPGALATPATAGTVPYALHLWAAGRTDLGPPPTHTPAVAGGRTAVVIAADRFLAREDRPFGAVAAGVQALGYRLDVREPGRLNAANCLRLLGGPPAVAVIWNGRRAGERELVARLQSLGTVVLQMEHGFLGDRHRATQIDHAGILHWASWARRLGEPAPDGAAERLAALGVQTRPVRRRKGGHILAVGQTIGDSQLDDCPIQAPHVLDRIVASALPPGASGYFRAHPLQPDRRSARLPRWDSPSEREAYMKSKTGGGLADAMADAACIVTINSNAGVEALAAGVPVLAFGPATYLQAGAGRQTSEATLRADLADVLDGWLPDQAAVDRYLGHLACRQWYPQELRDGAVLKRLIEEAKN